MPTPRPLCPYLPLPEGTLDFRYLRRSGVVSGQGANFYLSALTYGQFLWQERLTARALLAVTRALYTDLEGEESVVEQWPLPYAALAWLVANHPGDGFMGNPRLSFQHQADRVRGPRAPLKAARAWAVWRLIGIIRPDLPGDPRHHVTPPDDDAICHRLDLFGLPSEVTQWQAAKQEAALLKG